MPLIKNAIQVAAIIAMVRLWSSSHSLVWWSLFALFISDWLTHRAVYNAIRGSSGEQMEDYWAFINMVVTLALLILAVIGNILA